MKQSTIGNLKDGFVIDTTSDEEKDDDEGDDNDGITISPKKNFCIVKIWNGDKKQNSLELLNKIDDLPFDTCIFKEHR